MKFHSKHDGDATLSRGCIPIISGSMRKTSGKYTIPPSNYMTVIDREKRRRRRLREDAMARARSCKYKGAIVVSLLHLRYFAFASSHPHTFAFSPSEHRGPKGENASGSNGTQYPQLKTRSLFLKCNCKNKFSMILKSSDANAKNCRG